MPPSITIGRRLIGPGHPVYVIAEMSANHNQDFEQAVKIMQAAREAGADAIKLQTYTADTITLACDNPCFKIKAGTIWEGKQLHALYQEAMTPWEWQPKLKMIAEDLGLDLFSSPFDATAVDFLETMQVLVYKVASFEVVDIPLLRRIAATGKPVIMSTGMATLAEIEEAVCTLRAAGTREIALLKCTSAYPAAPEEMNLRTIPNLSETFQVPAGLSDHTMGSTVPIAAVALGACIVEKHFTLSRSVPGPDSAFSMEPHEFKEMVDSIRIAEKALGRVQYTPGERERHSRVFRRSLFVAEDMQEGETFTARNVRSVRPADGLHTRHLDEVLGTRARGPLKKGTPLRWEHVVREKSKDDGAEAPAGRGE